MPHVFFKKSLLYLFIRTTVLILVTKNSCRCHHEYYLLVCWLVDLLVGWSHVLQYCTCQLLSLYLHILCIHCLHWEIKGMVGMGQSLMCCQPYLLNTAVSNLSSLVSSLCVVCSQLDDPVQTKLNHRVYFPFLFPSSYLPHCMHTVVVCVALVV